MKTVLQGNRAQLKQHLFDVVSKRFETLVESESLNKQALADALGQSRIDVERMLSSPKYWTLDILADLVFALNCDIAFELREHSSASQSTPLAASNS